MTTSGSIADMAVNAELVKFVNDPQSDSRCGLSPMLAWKWPGQAAYGQTPYNQPPPYWPATTTHATNSTSVQIAVMAINNRIPSQSSLPAGATVAITDLTAIMLDTVMLFSFVMLFNQVAVFQAVNCVSSSDSILKICVGAVSAAEDAVTALLASGSVAVSLQTSLTSATDAVALYLSNLSAAQQAIPFSSTLSTLVPRMFTPYWTVSYLAAYGDGRMAAATFYDQRYASLAVASVFDSWLQYISTATSQSNLTDISNWFSTARASVASSVEGQTSLNNFYAGIRDDSNNTKSSIKTLQATNAQFERRRGSVGAMSENLTASQKRTDLAFTTLSLWVATLVCSLAVAGFLLRQRNFPMVMTLVGATITILTVDALGRGVAGASSSSA